MSPHWLHTTTVNDTWIGCTVAPPVVLQLDGFAPPSDDVYGDHGGYFLVWPVAREPGQEVEESISDEDADEYHHWFGAPMDLALTSDRLFVLDMGGEMCEPAVHVFDKALKHLLRIDEPRMRCQGGEDITSEAFCVYQNEVFLATLYTSEFHMFVYNLRGESVRKFGDAFHDPLGVTAIKDRIIVANFGSKELHVLSTHGDVLQVVTLDYQPHRICAHRDKLYVCDLRGHKIEVLQLLL